jgi:2-polyprenyl-3-methyl-5-hydroxy-6-metoxy-1,4-benzoquinol methylase
LEDVACILCGRDDPRVIYPSEHPDGLGTLSSDTFRFSREQVLSERLVECRRCGLQYVSPRVRAGLVLAGYRQDVSEDVVSQAVLRERTFSRSLERIQRITGVRGGKLLDIGTGSGAFLAVARDQGWEAHGCEVNRWLCQWVQEHYGIRVDEGTLHELNYPGQAFDLVTLWDVLEHTPDPRAVLGECHRILRQSGMLVVNYPDIGSWIARLMGRHWVFLLQVHLYYFTRATIQALLERTGFELLWIGPYFQTLELGFVFHRMRPHSYMLSRLGVMFVERLRISHFPFTYWMGQTLALARRA